MNSGSQNPPPAAVKLRLETKFTHRFQDPKWVRKKLEEASSGTEG